MPTMRKDNNAANGMIEEDTISRQSRQPGGLKDWRVLAKDDLVVQKQCSCSLNKKQHLASFSTVEKGQSKKYIVYTN